MLSKLLNLLGPVNVVSLRCVGWRRAGRKLRARSGHIFRWHLEFPGVHIETLFLSRELESKFHIFEELSLINTIHGILYCLCEDGCVGCKDGVVWVCGGVSCVIRWLCSEDWWISSIDGCVSSVVRWLCSEDWSVSCENGCVCKSVLRCCDMHLLTCDWRGVCVALGCVVWWGYQFVPVL